MLRQAMWHYIILSPRGQAVEFVHENNGGFPNDIRPVNIKLKRVSENINSNRVSVNIKKY